MTKLNSPSGRCGPIRAMLLLALASGPGIVCAQDAAVNFPVKTIRIIVPFTPGGSNDILGRFIGAKLTERLGQQVIVDNRPGAGGVIGSDVAAKASPDGYTLLFVSTSYAMNAAIRKLPFDPVNGFAPVAVIGTGPNILAVTPTLPVNSVKQLIALAKAKPAQLHYASAGVGGFNHFGGELFKLAAGVDLVHVPYKGGAPAMTDVMAGQVAVLFNALPSALPHVRSSKLKPLGVGSLKRSPVLPDVPTIAEAGVPGYEAVIWWGVLAPAGTPVPVVSKLNSEIAAILRDPEAAKRLSAEAAEPMVAPPQTFGKLVVDEITKWTKVAKSSGIHTE